jgi:hypothetical protein
MVVLGSVGVGRVSSSGFRVVVWNVIRLRVEDGPVVVELGLLLILVLWLYFVLKTVLRYVNVLLVALRVHRSIPLYFQGGGLVG